MELQEYNRRLSDAREKIVSMDEREKDGIGMQKEKSLHAILKLIYDEDPAHHEQPVGPYIADLKDNDHITEIQTANMGNLRDKLSFYLDDFRVKVVYPIPHKKYITWIDSLTGELGKRSPSTRTGTFFHAFRELYKIRNFLGHPHLEIELLLIDLEEYRLKDGWSRDGKRGSHRFDRIPVQIADRITLSAKEDYAALLTEEIRCDLPDVFTAAQLEKACGYKGPTFSHVPLILTDLRVLERVGKNGRAYLYKIREKQDAVQT